MPIGLGIRMKQTWRALFVKRSDVERPFTYQQRPNKAKFPTDFNACKLAFALVLNALLIAVL